MSPAVLVKHGLVVDRQRAVDVQTTLTELSSDDEHTRVADPLRYLPRRARLARRLPRRRACGPDLLDTLVAVLPEHEDHLRPTYAIRDPERPMDGCCVVQAVDGDDFDKVPPPDAQRTRLARQSACAARAPAPRDGHPDWHPYQ